MARKNLHKAQAAGVFRTIPDSKPVETVGTSQANFELDDFNDGGTPGNGTDLSGKWVTFRATVGTITIQRATSDPSLTAGQGFTIDVDTQQELYIDPDGEMTCYAIADTASSKLWALVDSE